MKISKILIAIDDSRYAEKATAYGFELAKLYNANVGLVNVIEPVVVPTSDADNMIGLPFTTPNVNDAELMRIQAESSENIIQRTIKTFAGDREVTQFSEYGSSADGILKCANEFGADLIVLGMHHRSGIDRLLMGNTAEEVVRHTKIPVLAVPFVE
jgi:nucleotide-binding universal stress UspA family protein